MVQLCHGCFTTAERPPCGARLQNDAYRLLIPRSAARQLYHALSKETIGMGSTIWLIQTGCLLTHSLASISIGSWSCFFVRTRSATSSFTHEQALPESRLALVLTSCSPHLATTYGSLPNEGTEGREGKESGVQESLQEARSQGDRE